MNFPHTRLIAALAADDASTRLKAALAIGTHPDARLATLLIERCAIESDFYVRDMLTWALIRLPPQSTVPLLLTELESAHPQARSQALHTLSKIKDPDSWPAITPRLLRDADDEVARSAWRAAVVLVPDARRQDLATALATQLGRGNRDLQLSLSRALVALEEEALMPVLRLAMASDNPVIQAHAKATEQLLRDPDAGFAPDVNDAKRIFALSKAPKPRMED